MPRRRAFVLPAVLFACVLAALASASALWVARAGVRTAQGVDRALADARRAESGVSWALGVRDGRWPAAIGDVRVDTIIVSDGPVIVSRRRLSSAWWITGMAGLPGATRASGALAVILPVTQVASMSPDALTGGPASANIGVPGTRVVRVAGPGWADLQ
jgi:hypothetical protein